MKNLLAKINTLHVNYEVLTVAILHLSEEEQVKVNKRITESLGLPVHATASAIKNERQKRVDDVNDYDVIMDAFILLEKIATKYDAEILAEAQMFIASIKHE